MNNCVFQLLQIAILFCASLIIGGCDVVPSPKPTQTPSSPLADKLLGTWQVTSGGPWGDALITFTQEGEISVQGGLQEPEAHGSYAFIDTATISFQFPTYNGTAQLELPNDNRLELMVRTSTQTFGVGYVAERAEVP